MVDSGPLTFVGRLTRAELIAFAMHDLLRRRGRRLVASSLTIPAAFLVMIWLTHSPISLSWQVGIFLAGWVGGMLARCAYVAAVIHRQGEAQQGDNTLVLSEQQIILRTAGGASTTLPVSELQFEQLDKGIAAYSGATPIFYLPRRVMTGEELRQLQAMYDVRGPSPALREALSADRLIGGVLFALLGLLIAGASFIDYGRFNDTLLPLLHTLWPTSFMMMALSGIPEASAHAWTTVFVGFNAVLYFLFGWALASVRRRRPRTLGWSQRWREGQERARRLNLQTTPEDMSARPGPWEEPPRKVQGDGRRGQVAVGLLVVMAVVVVGLAAPYARGAVNDLRLRLAGAWGESGAATAKRAMDSVPAWAWALEPTDALDGRVEVAKRLGDLKALAAAGDMRAQVLVGNYLFFRDYDLAEGRETGRRLIEQAANKGDARAQTLLGTFFEHGWGVPADAAKAAELYRQAAGQGYARGQWCLAQLTEAGSGVAQNQTEAVHLYRDAANQGLAEAQFELGRLSEWGPGVPQNLDDAMRWYRFSADQGYSDAFFAIGSMYDRGRGVPRDYAESMRWFRRAADRGDPQAKVFIGEHYTFGRGVRTDYAEALKWYQQAAAQNFRGAYAEIGYHYQNGLGVPQDYAEAIRLYRKGADLGDSLALEYLAYMYFNGKGVKQDNVEALRLFKLSAQNRNPSAGVPIGYMYDHGLGVAVDHIEAVRWFRLAANAGSSAGQWDLGAAYADGVGVPKDMAKARALIRQAADQGETGAQKWLADHPEGAAKP